MERENASLHRSRTLDDVFGCVNVCNNDTQDPLVAEFGPDFENFPVHRPNGMLSSHTQAVVQETMTVRESELQWMKRHVQQQQELIAEMQKQLSSLQANQVGEVVEQQHQHKSLQVSSE